MDPDASIVDKLCYALHNIQFLKEMPAGFNGEIFNLLFDSAEISNFTPDEKIKYENDMTTERDIRNQIRFAEKQGVKQGAEQERIAIARKMLAMGLNPEQVSQATDLSLEDIANL